MLKNRLKIFLKSRKKYFLGDFNTGIDEQKMTFFCENCNLKSLIRQAVRLYETVHQIIRLY